MRRQIFDLCRRMTGSRSCMLAADWERVGHGWFQQSLKQADNEEDVTRHSLASLKHAPGKKTRAWLGPGVGSNE